MKKIKIMHVLTVYNTGGLETMIMNYWREIDREKFQFDFLLQREDGYYEKEAEDLGGKIFRISKLSYSPLDFVKYLMGINHFFKNHQYDIVHVHTNSFGYFPLYFAKKYKIPVRIIHCHISGLDDDKAKLFVGKILNNQFPKVANQFFACGQEAGEWMFKSQNFVILPNAILAKNFSFNIAIRKPIQQELQSKNQLNIINIGRFNPQKNHHFILEIFSEVIKINPNVHLYLVGDGELKQEIEHKINSLQLNSHVTLLGVRADVNEILQAMDVFLFPSLFEGLPVSMIEAQAAGLRCVISDGVPDEAILIPDNVKKIELKKSAKYWAKEILDFSAYERKDTYEIIKNKGYDIVENAKRLELKYQELLENARRSASLK